ncbi:MAG: LysE family translocator, partial [Pseudomonadota bacterium]
IATAFGLAQVFQSSDWLVPVLRYVGSAYLVWLGIDMIRGAKSAAQVTLQTDSVKQQSVTKIMWQGVLVEVLNPKTVLFFALFLPPFINFHEGQDMSLVQLQLLILGILVPLTAIPADLVVAFAGGSLARLVNHRRQMRERMAWVCGLVLIGIAIHLHWPIL